MGLDYGDKTIGVSVSSPSAKVAIGITTITRDNSMAIRPSLKELKAIMREHKITHIVLGYPKHLDGRDSERCTKTMQFKEKLNRYFKSTPVELWDERLSTRAVTRVFEGKQSDYKKHVDEMAAVYILQGYLDRREKKMRDENELNPQISDENDENQEMLVLYDEDGDELELLILSYKVEGDVRFVLAADDDGSVLLLKCTDAVDSEEDTIVEMVDEEHDEFDHVFKLFEKEFEKHGIELVDVDLESVDLNDNDANDIDM